MTTIFCFAKEGAATTNSSKNEQIMASIESNVKVVHSVLSGTDAGARRTHYRYRNGPNVRIIAICSEAFRTIS